MARKSEAKRTANFTTQEVIILLEIVKQHKHIIECKQSDKLLWSKKNQTWLKIADLFNARSALISRDATVLKKKYENLKKVTKKRYADEKCAVRGTDGGSAMPSLITPIDEEIKELIDGCEAVYDSDILKVLQVSDSCDITLATSSNNANESYMPGHNDTAGVESSNSGADICISGKGLNTDKWERLAEAKLELVHLKCSLVQKEYDLKKKQMNKEQELIQKSYEQKMQHDEEEHNLRMQKLKYELQLLKKQAS